MRRVATTPRRFGKAGSSRRQSLRAWQFPGFCRPWEGPSPPAAPGSFVRSLCHLAASADRKPGNQPNEQSDTARPVRGSLGNREKRIVKQVVGGMQAGDKPLVTVFDERSTPTRWQIKRPAVIQFEVLGGATEGNSRAAAVDDRKFVDINSRLIARDDS